MFSRRADASARKQKCFDRQFAAQSTARTPTEELNDVNGVSHN
jgi:hypothetical protein